MDCEKHLQYVCYSCDSITKVNKISQMTNTPRDIVIYKVWSSREWRVLDVLVSEWCSSGDEMKKPEMERDDFVSEDCRYNARQLGGCRNNKVLDILVSEWCSSGDEMKKPWMDSTLRTFHSGL